MNNNMLRFGIAAATVIVLAFVGIRFLPGSGLPGGPPPTPTPVVSPTPVPALPTGSMPPGTYAVTDPQLTLVPYNITVPAGWIGGDGASRGDISTTGVRITTWGVVVIAASLPRAAAACASARARWRSFGSTGSLMAIASSA